MVSSTIKRTLGEPAGGKRPAMFPPLFDLVAAKYPGRLEHDQAEHRGSGQASASAASGP